MSALVLVQEELEELAPAADETAVWVVEAMDVQVASGLSVVGVLWRHEHLRSTEKSRSRCLKISGRNEISRWHTW